MKTPYEKYARIELISVLVAILIGLFAVIKGYLFLILISFYFIALSLFAEALVDLSCNRKTQAGKQIFRALMVFLFTTYIIFKI